MSIIKRNKGFTLLEMLLVILVMTAIAFFAIRMQEQKMKEIRVNHAAAQINQIFAAATSYYIDNGDWPYKNKSTPQDQDEADNITLLTDDHYLPKSWLADGADTLMSPFGSPYVLGPQGSKGAVDSKQAMYSVSLDNLTQMQATALKAKLPMSYIKQADDGKDKYKLTAFVSIPSYDYNHAADLSDVGVYHPGDCIPKPTYACPRGMKAATFVTVEQAYGFGQGTNQQSGTVYPITGISAYAQSGDLLCPDMPTGGSYVGNDQQSHQINPPCGDDEDRVCIRLTTTNGAVDFSKFTKSYAQTIGVTYLLAMTKCVPDNNK